MHASGKLCLGLGLVLAVAGVAFVNAAAAHADGLVYGDPLNPPYYNWSGLYVGANVGGNWGDATAIDQLATNGVPWNRLGDKFSATGGDFTAAGSIGYNWQHSLLLVGLEGDVGFLGDNGRAVSSIASNTRISGEGGAFITLRGRLGIVCNESLLYATGGYFGADMESRVFSTNGVLSTATPGFQSGWTAGAGWETMIMPALSVKVEYLHYDLGTDRVGGAIGGGVIQFFDVQNTGDLVRVGLNYRFGDRSAPCCGVK